MLTRRATLAGGLTLGACSHRREPTDANRVESLLRVLEQEVGGRIGVAALDTSNGARISYRGERRFAMCSSFKWLLAAVALERLDSNEVLPIAQSDLLFNSPVTSVHIGGAMSVEALCEATIVTSDNAAANLLLRRLGGPERFRAYLLNNVDAVTRIDRYEPELNENAPGDPRDTTTPDAMVRTMNRLLVEDGLRPENRERVLGWMVACQTGLDRLRGGFSPDWRAGDKTGTSDGEHNATNDVAIAWPPSKSGPILIACFMSDSVVDLTARKAAHARIGRMIAAAWG